MARGLVSLLSGLLFGAGLTLSQMVNPAKVMGFLDFAGDWDPSLAFVMGGALAVTFVSYRFTLRRRRAPIAAAAFQVPATRDIDGRLVGGAAVFGVGWGMSGFCPGPAIVSLAYGLPAAMAFVAAMVAGMVLYHLSAAQPATELGSDG